MDIDNSRRKMLRLSLLATAAAALTACGPLIPPGQIRRHQTPAATGTAPGQAKKKP